MATHVSDNISQVYAEALYSVAQAQDAVTRVEEELLALRELLEREARFRAFFETPVVSFAKKRTVIEAVLKDVADCTRNFVLVLVNNQRISLLPAIWASYHRIHNDKLGITEFQVESARAFEPAEMDKLKESLERKLNRKVIIAEKVRPELLGGFVLAHDDRRWDASLVNRLGRMAAALEEVKSNLGVWAE